MILLDRDEIEIEREAYSVESRKIWDMDRTREWKLRKSRELESCFSRTNKAQAKKIALKLQKIYNLPDEGMFNKKLGEFIQQLMEEVKQ